MSVLVHGYFDAERTQTRQHAQDPGYEQLERKQHPVVGEVYRECLDELAPGSGGTCER